MNEEHKKIITPKSDIHDVFIVLINKVLKVPTLLALIIFFGMLKMPKEEIQPFLKDVLGYFLNSSPLCPLLLIFSLVCWLLFAIWQRAMCKAENKRIAIERDFFYEQLGGKPESSEE